MKKLFTTLFAITLSTNIAFSQGTSINTTGAPADPSAMLDVSSTNKGFTMPRMSTAERNAISSPTNGLMIWNTTTNCMDVFALSGWYKLSCVCTGPPATPGAISGTANLCANSTGNIYSISPVFSAISYTWTVPAGATITAGQGTTSITVTFGGNSGSITATANNSCGSSSPVSQAITVVATPSAPAPNAGSAITCTAFNANWSAASMATVYYLDVASDTGFTNILTGYNNLNVGNALTQQISGLANHTNYYYRCRASNFCGTSSSSGVITVTTDYPTPATPGTISGPAVVVGFSTGNIYSVGAVTGASVYNWTLPAGCSITAGAGGNIITVTFGTTAGNVSVTAGNTCGTSAASSLPVSIAVYSPGSQTFYYTGAVQLFNVPSGVISMNVDAMGAAGGGSGTPGQGGRVQATFAVTPFELLYIYVGGQGGMDVNADMPGGFNGGGRVPQGTWAPMGSGGGATDIRRGGTALTDRIIVAGGAGGSSESTRTGGQGGGLTGGNGTSGCPVPGYGGTQTAGGAGGGANGCGCTTFLAGNPGTLGLGGDGVNSCCFLSGCTSTNHISSAGGGGGYYGGGGGGTYSSGGGGSSYTLPGATNVIHTQGYQAGNGQLTLTW